MLDLTKKVNRYEIKWFDGQVLHLEMPSQALLMKVMEMDKLEDDKEQIEALNAVLLTIMNSNVEGRVFTGTEIGSIPLDIIELILSDYINTVNTHLGE